MYVCYSNYSIYTFIVESIPLSISLSILLIAFFFSLLLIFILLHSSQKSGEKLKIEKDMYKVSD